MTRAAKVPSMARLQAAARTAQTRAYAPYSGFRVGAAVAAGGKIFTGANVENASYGLTICAERTAIAAAVHAGQLRIDAVAVITDASPPSAPCGMCRQVMREFTSDPARVAVVAFNPAGAERAFSLADLLPDSFAGDELPPPPRRRR